MDAQLPEDFDPYDAPVRMTMMDIPRSTLAVGLALWGVLVGLGAWNLSVTSDMRAEQRGQSEGLKAVNGRVDDMGRQVQRNTDDIRELQRGKQK